MSKVQTDNSYLEAKIKLRIENIPAKESLKILDLYGGDGHIWNTIKERTKINITLLRIDKKKDKKGIYLKGDNLKFLMGFDLDAYDVIDIDAYGIPYEQLKYILNSNYKGIIFITYIQSMFGGLQKKMLRELNYTDAMIKKIPTLFNTDGLGKLKQWLALYGITKIKRISFEKKHYLAINLGEQ